MAEFVLQEPPEEKVGIISLPLIASNPRTALERNMSAKSLLIQLCQLTAAFFLVLFAMGTNPNAMSEELPVHVEIGFSTEDILIVPSNVPWVKTPLQMRAGKWYRITAQASPDYKDKVMPCTAVGPKGFLGWLFDHCGRCPGRLNPLRYKKSLGVSKRLRVLRDGTAERRRASFLTLIAAIGMDDSAANAIVIGRFREFQAPKNGPLYFFSNDWPGGVGLESDNRFRNPALTGPKALPTYGNNQGCLTVTVTEIPQPDQ